MGAGDMYSYRRFLALCVIVFVTVEICCCESQDRHLSENTGFILNYIGAHDNVQALITGSICLSMIAEKYMKHIKSELASFKTKGFSTTELVTFDGDAKGESDLKFSPEDISGIVKDVNKNIPRDIAGEMVETESGTRAFNGNYLLYIDSFTRQESGDSRKVVEVVGDIFESVMKEYNDQTETKFDTFNNRMLRSLGIAKKKLSAYLNKERVMWFIYDVLAGYNTMAKSDKDHKHVYRILKDMLPLGMFCVTFTSKICLSSMLDYVMSFLDVLESFLFYEIDIPVVSPMINGLASGYVDTISRKESIPGIESLDIGNKKLSFAQIVIGISMILASGAKSSYKPAGGEGEDGSSDSRVFENSLPNDTNIPDIIRYYIRVVNKYSKSHQDGGENTGNGRFDSIIGRPRDNDREFESFYGISDEDSTSKDVSRLLSYLTGWSVMTMSIMKANICKMEAEDSGVKKAAVEMLKLALSTFQLVFSFPQMIYIQSGIDNSGYTKGVHSKKIKDGMKEIYVHQVTSWILKMVSCLMDFVFHTVENNGGKVDLSLKVVGFLIVSLPSTILDVFVSIKQYIINYLSYLGKTKRGSGGAAKENIMKLLSLLDPESVHQYGQDANRLGLVDMSQIKSHIGGIEEKLPAYAKLNAAGREFAPIVGFTLVLNHHQMKKKETNENDNVEMVTIDKVLPLELLAKTRQDLIKCIVRMFSLLGHEVSAGNGFQEILDGANLFGVLNVSASGGFMVDLANHLIGGTIKREDTSRLPENVVNMSFKDIVSRFTNKVPSITDKKTEKTKKTPHREKEKKKEGSKEKFRVREEENQQQEDGSEYEDDNDADLTKKLDGMLKEIQADENGSEDNLEGIDGLNDEDGDYNSRALDKSGNARSRKIQGL